MGIGQCVMMALKSLAKSKMRAFLTMLGIIIGVGAVIVIMSMGNGIQVYISDMFADLGTTSISVNITGRGSTRSVSVDDMYELYDEHPELYSAMSPTVSVQGAQIKIDPAYDTDSYFCMSVTGASEEYMGGIKGYELDAGRNITFADIDAYAKVCVVGAFYDYLYNGNTVGSFVKIGGEKFTIIGVVEEQSDKTDDTGTDNFIIVPYSTAAKQLSRTATITTFTFVAKDETKIDTGIATIKQRLYQTFRNEDLYSVTSLTQIVDVMNDMIGIVVSILSGIAAISLVVGGIGIMNIMLVSVTERTREIGIRKALGAKGRHIRLQFVIEAGTTSAIGGVFGILLGIFAARVVSSIFADDGFTAVPTVFAVLLSFGISVGIGVVFGYLPANKAAKLNPIEALHYD